MTTKRKTGKPRSRQDTTLELAFADMVKAGKRLDRIGKARRRPELRLAAILLGGLVATLRERRVNVDELHAFANRIDEWELESIEREKELN